MISHEDKGNDPSTGKMRVPSMSPHEDNGAKLRLEKRRALAMLSHERVKCDRATRKKLRAPTTMSPSLTLARKIPRDAWPGRAVVCSPFGSNTGAPLDAGSSLGDWRVRHPTKSAPRPTPRSPPRESTHGLREWPSVRGNTSFQPAAIWHIPGAGVTVRGASRR